MIQFSDFEKKTKIVFKNKNLLKQAFIHRSFINENPRAGLSHNERLEFLGDAVLELVVTCFLYKNIQIIQKESSPLFVLHLLILLLLLKLHQI